jgi:hypothetical protein
MRLTMLAIIFFLILTLGNAYMYREGHAWIVARDYAAIQLSHKLVVRVQRDAFVWREIGAVVITMLIFGAIASIRIRNTSPPAGNQVHRVAACECRVESSRRTTRE